MNQLCAEFPEAETAAAVGNFTIVVENEGEVATWEFQIEEPDAEFVTDIKRPRRTRASGRTSLIAFTKTCPNKNQTQSSSTRRNNRDGKNPKKQQSLEDVDVKAKTVSLFET